MKLGRVFIYLFILIVAVAVQARTQGHRCKTKRVVVVPYPFKDGSAQKAARDFTAAAAMNSCFSLRDVYSIIEGEDSKVIPDLDKAQTSLNQGIKAFTAGSYANALDLLQDSARIYLSNYAAAGMSGDVTLAYMYLGSTLAALGRQQESQAAFGMALTLDPAVDIYAVTSLTKAVEIFEQVQSGLSSRPVGGAIIASNPKGALVYVDGSFKGSTPISLTGLSAGRHVVALMMVGFKRETRVIDVHAGEVTQVQTVVMVSTPRASLLEGQLRRLLKGDEKAYVDAKATLASDLLVVCQERSGKVKTSLFDLNHRTALVKTAKLPDKGVQMARQVLKGLIEDSNKNLTTPPAARTGKKGGGDSIVKKWWFWTAIGAVIVGGTTAAVLLTRHSGGNTGMKKDGTGGIILVF